VAKMVNATFYVQIEPEWSRWTPDVLMSAKAARLTQSKPGKTSTADAVVVKMTVQLPESVFRPFVPEAVVVVPESMAGDVIDVEAVDVMRPAQIEAGPTGEAHE
jgi:hypothetical protein